MAEQTERADLARVYRAIGNSKAPMPESIGTFPDGDVYLVFDKGNEPAVRIWAEAIGATVGRSTVSASGVHRFGTLDGGGKAGTWLGRCVHVYTYVHDEHPATGPAVLGAGDEPADEAIVPAGQPRGEHYEARGWKGGPGEYGASGECGVECACGTTFDGFDTLAEAGEHLATHIRQANEATVPAEAEQPQDWYFTWGAGQTLPDGSDADNHYTAIAGTHAEARAEMVARFGTGWCDQYPGHEAAGVDQFRLKRVMPLAWPKRFEPDGSLRTTHDDPDDDLAPNAGSAS